MYDDLLLSWVLDGLAEVAAELADEPEELDLSTPEEPTVPDLNGENINALYLATAGLDATDDEIQILGEVLAETEQENAVLGNWLAGPPAPEPGYDLAGDWPAIELADYEQQAAGAQRHAAARALARQYAQAATAEGDFRLAGRVLADLANDASATIDLAGDDGQFTGACGPVDDLGYCRSAAHALDCVHSGTVEADEADMLPGGLTGTGAALRDRLESMSGIRMRGRESPFGPAPRAVAEQPKASPLPAVPAHIRAAIATQRPELFSPSADAVRERARDRAMDRIVNTAMHTGGRAAHLGDGESPRERSERLRRPVELREVGDTGLPGAPAVRGYTLR